MPRRTYRTSRLGAVYTRHGRGEPMVLVQGSATGGRPRTQCFLGGPGTAR